MFQTVKDLQACPTGPETARDPGANTGQRWRAILLSLKVLVPSQITSPLMGARSVEAGLRPAPTDRPLPEPRTGHLNLHQQPPRALTGYP